MPKRNAAAFAVNARRQLDQTLTALPIFSILRSPDLLNYLTVLEAESVKAAAFSPGSALTNFSAHRQAVESSAHAVPAILGGCPNDQVLPSQTVQREIFDLAYDLFTFTQKYDQIDYSYRLADRGHLHVSVANKDPRISFSYASSDADDADTLARSREILAKVSRDGWTLDPEALSGIFEELRSALQPQTRLTAPEMCEYTINDDVLRAMRDLSKAINRAMPAGLEPSVKVGEFNFADFRSFWCALLSFIQTHTMAHDLACGGDVTKFPIRTIVINKPRTGMIRLLASIAELPPQAAAFILQCFLFDPITNGKGPISQPFLPIAEDHLCVSSLLVAFNDFRTELL